MKNKRFTSWEEIHRKSQIRKQKGDTPNRWLIWGTHGKDNQQPISWIFLEDLESDHIQNILLTQHQITDFYKDELIKELGRRLQKYEQKQ